MKKFEQMPMWRDGESSVRDLRALWVLGGSEFKGRAGGFKGRTWWSNLGSLGFDLKVSERMNESSN